MFGASAVAQCPWGFPKKKRMSPIHDWFIPCVCCVFVCLFCVGVRHTYIDIYVCVCVYCECVYECLRVGGGVVACVCVFAWVLSTLLFSHPLFFLLFFFLKKEQGWFSLHLIRDVSLLFVLLVAVCTITTLVTQTLIIRSTLIQFFEFG